MRKKIIIALTNGISYDNRMLKTAKTLVYFGYEVQFVGRNIAGLTLPNPDFAACHRFRMWWNAGFLFYAEYQIRLFFYLMFHDFDEILSVDLDTVLPSILAHKLKRKKLVLDCHELFPEVPEVANRPWVKQIWTWVEKLAFSMNFPKYTVSQSIADWYQTHYHTKCEVVFNFPEFEKNEDFPNHFSQKIILYQGDLNEGRGLEEAILAMKKIEASLWIVGRGLLEYDLKTLTTEHQLTEKVKFWGAVLPSELPKIVAQATIGLNLLKNKGLNYYYSAANKFFDSVQVCVPVLTMDFPEYKRFIHEYRVGEMIETLSVDSVETALKKMLSDADVYQTCRTECQKARTVWIWEMQTDILRGIFLGIGQSPSEKSTNTISNLKTTQ